ncbi:MAG: L-seryl-tRNA(Sec) selenium transferase [Oscillospiraceae bacterium]|nr:L-seryl-tRNA(Sec) selenium transferase [Oscillospiraceae bacterium]
MHIENNLYKRIPQVDKLMQHELISNCEVYRHEIVETVRDVLADLREGLRIGKIDKIPCDDDIAKKVVDLAGKRTREQKGIRRVINGTGVILHSNLGRASLSKAAAKEAVEIASSYCTLEYDIEKGKRGNRAGGIEKYLQNLTGCESSLIVNNNAAAVLLILSSMASDGNVIVSRGELVEIGGGFRVPDIISQCGCKLREVGTTNKTRIADYEAAIDKDTRAILKVHTSNFKVVGFTESVSIKELTTLGKLHNIPVIEDIGSGALVDVQKYGLHDEPLAKESLKNGADIVSFSGDKLLGGLQCGIILGQKKYVEAMKKHPLYRAFRVDKMTIAVMEATLRVYADLSLAERDIPVLSMLSMTDEALRLRVEKLCEEIQKNGGDVEVIKTKSVAGGGAVPGLELDSYAIALKGALSVEKLEKKLREQPVPIIGRIESDRLVLDVRTIFEDDFDYVAKAVADVSG